MAEKVFVCGDGTLIPLTCRYLVEMGKEVAVISDDESLRTEGYMDVFIPGDPTVLEVLSKSDIEKAQVVLVIAREDWDAAFIVMNTRKVNPEAVIVANVNREGSAEKLYSLGASRVVFPLSVSGHLIASSAASPVLAEFMDRIILTQDIEIGHLEIGKDSKLSGRTLSEVNVCERTGCRVIGLIDEEKTFLPNPSPNEVILPGQTLICLGKSENLRSLFENVKPVQRI
jgi:voltage-gated potassium channel